MSTPRAIASQSITVVIGRASSVARYDTTKADARAAAQQQRRIATPQPAAANGRIQRARQRRRDLIAMVRIDVDDAIAGEAEAAGEIAQAEMTRLMRHDERHL